MPTIHLKHGQSLRCRPLWMLIESQSICLQYTDLIRAQGSLRWRSTHVTQKPVSQKCMAVEKAKNFMFKSKLQLEK